MGRACGCSLDVETVESVAGVAVAGVALPTVLTEGLKVREKQQLAFSMAMT
jgi:hypothetical protein